MIAADTVILRILSEAVSKDCSNRIEVSDSKTFQAFVADPDRLRANRILLLER